MSKSDRKFYDEAFMEVFTNRKIVKSLLEDFIHEEWVNLLDFSHMEANKSVFKGIDDSKRESDLLLKFPLKNREDENLFIFILMEFQSTPKSMIIRLLEYLTRIYKKQKSNSHVLFPVIPIVVYNGKEIWKEKISFIEHFHIYSKDIQKYLPQFEYILIDIARFDEDLLKQFNDSVSWFFMLDKTDIYKRDKAAERIIQILRKLKQVDPEIFNLLGRYISGLLIYKGVDINRINEYINNRGESMLAQSIDEFSKEMHDEGFEEGKLINMQDTLIRQLGQKFCITPENQELIKSEKNAENLSDALDIILFAKTADEVLSPLKKQ